MTKRETGFLLIGLGFGLMFAIAVIFEVLLSLSRGESLTAFDIDKVLLLLPVLLLVIGVAVCELAVWGRRQAALASGRAAYLAGIREAAEVVAVGGSGSKLVQDVSAALVRTLGLKSCLFERGVAGVGQPARLLHDGDVQWQGKAWDVDRRGLPQDTDIELLVESGGQLVGRFLMRADADTHPSRTQRVVAVVLGGQVSGALGRRG